MAIKPIIALGAMFLTAIMALTAFTNVAVNVSDTSTARAQAVPTNAPFRIGVPGYNVATLNPFLYLSTDEYMTIWPVYSTVLTYDLNMNVIGDLATSWSTSTDGLTWTFNLANNAFFVDPANPTSMTHPVTAADVMYTLNLCQIGGYSLHYYDNLITSMTSDTPYDLTVHLAYPYAPFVYTLTVIPIIPKYYWQPHEVKGDPTMWGITVPIGSGAFYYATTGLPISQAQLKRNPIWFQETNKGWQIQVSDLIFKAEMSAYSAGTDLLNSQIDAMTYVTPDQYLGSLQGVPNIQLFAPSEGFVYEFNLNQMTDAMRNSLGGIFARGSNNQLLLDPTVKMALTMCVDKQLFVNAGLSGLGSVADSLVPDTSPWHYDYGSSPGEAPITYDPAAARALLMNAGWTYRLDGSQILPGAPDYWTYYPLCKLGGTEPLRFRFYAPSESMEYNMAGRIIATAAGQAGVDLWSSYTLMSFNQMNAVWASADYDVWVWNWVFSVNADPSVDIMSVLTTQAIGWYSDVFYSDPTYDSIYFQSIQETDTAARHLLIDQLQRIAYESSGCVPVAYKPSLYAVSTAKWTNYGDWNVSVLLSPDQAMPYLYLQLVPITTPPTNSPPTVALGADLYVVLKKSSNVYTVTANDPDGDALKYTWNWGDGTTTVTFTNSATHSYSKKGTFTLTVTVDDQTGLAGHIVSDSGLVKVMWPKLA